MNNFLCWPNLIEIPTFYLDSLTDDGLHAPDAWFSERECHKLKPRVFLAQN